MRPGVRIAVDVGRARIGVARSDPDGLLAVPVETIARDLTTDAHLERLVTLTNEYAASEVIVGHPLNLRGEATASTEDAVTVARALAELIDVPVRLLDERLTTVSAARQFRASGKQASRSRNQIDQAAAVVLLQDALDRERASGQAAGIPLD